MTIVYILIALIVGWVIGFLDSNIRANKKIEAAEARAEQAAGEAERKIAEVQAQIKMGRAVSDNPDLLRLRNVGGVYQLEVDGASLKSESASADRRRRLIELLTAIRPWVEGGSPLSPAPRPAVPPFTQSSAAPAASASSADLASIETPPGGNTTDQKALKSLSIVAQIDSILQARLAGTPLIEKGIRLAESAQGGVEVYVGIDKFPTIDDVPDPQIKSAIRAAVAEWEEKFTPGE